MCVFTQSYLLQKADNSADGHASGSGMREKGYLNKKQDRDAIRLSHYVKVNVLVFCQMQEYNMYNSIMLSKINLHD